LIGLLRASLIFSPLSGLRFWS